MTQSAIFLQNVIHITETIDLRDVYTGKYVVKNILRKTLCSQCNGIGSDDGVLRVCKKCQGRRILVSPDYEIRTCEYCNGSGINSVNHKCSTCRGSRVVDETYAMKFLIPVGIAHGETINISDIGNINIGNNSRDEVIITVEIRNVSDFTIVDGVLSTTLHIQLVEALCGIDREINLPDGSVAHINKRTITKTNDVLVMEGVGLPAKNNKYSKGKLHVKLVVDYPEKLSDEVSRRVREALV